MVLSVTCSRKKRKLIELWTGWLKIQKLSYNTAYKAPKVKRRTDSEKAIIP